MKKLFAALVAATFALSAGAAFAQDKKADESKKETPPPKKEKKGGC